MSPPLRNAVRASVSLGFLVAIAVPSAAAAEPSVHALHVDIPLDLTVTGSAAALWAGSELFGNVIGPRQCRWCGADAKGVDNVNGLDREVREALRWTNTGLADRLSYGTAFVLAPLLSFGGTTLAAGNDGALKGAFTDAVIIGEATMLAISFNQILKFVVARERPFFHSMPGELKTKYADSIDQNLSFFSGHTTLAFVLAASSGTVASMRGYRLAPLIWGSGMSFAFVSGYLRIAADRHYFSDVLVGAVLGVGIGMAVPLLLHGRADGASSTATPLSSAPPALGYGGVW